MDKRKSNKNLWVAIGAVVLIVLLIVWLTVADFFGDTDVAALMTPAHVCRFVMGLGL